jgi:hypothetical protein
MLVSFFTRCGLALGSVLGFFTESLRLRAPCLALALQFLAGLLYVWSSEGGEKGELDAR